jgi:hypothetical protein
VFHATSHAAQAQRDQRGAGQDGKNDERVLDYVVAKRPLVGEAPNAT